MVVLSNSLTDLTDEGSLKLATTLIKKMKLKYSDTYVISFEREFSMSDKHMKLNKFHFSFELLSILKRTRQKLLYIPFPAPMSAMVIRIFLLSLFSKKRLDVLLTRKLDMNFCQKSLLKLSRANVIVFSKDSYFFYNKFLSKRVKYLKTGIDIHKFVPVSKEEQRNLKLKYGFDPEKKIVLHVGHMKEGRNIAELLKINDKYQVVLVVSTLSKERQNDVLRDKLSSKSNIKIIDYYISNIEEIYQMSDVYFFPVKQMGHCIDIPLSCLEAAACNKPVITTDYGEMSEFKDKQGFYFIDDFSEREINCIIGEAILMNVGGRYNIKEYDWTVCIGDLIS